MAFGDALAGSASGHGFHAWATRGFLIGSAVMVFGLAFCVIVWEAEPPHWAGMVGKIMGVLWLTSWALSFCSIPWRRP